MKFDRYSYDSSSGNSSLFDDEDLCAKLRGMGLVEVKKEEEEEEENGFVKISQRELQEVPEWRADF